METKGIHCITTSTIQRMIKYLEKGAARAVINELKIIIDPHRQQYVAIRPDELVAIWEQITGLTLPQIQRKNRKLSIRYARYVLAVTLYECTNLSEVEVGELVGYGDHTGVNHARDQIKINLKLYPDDQLAKMYRAVIDAVANSKKPKEVAQ